MSKWAARWRALKTDHCTASPDLWLRPCCDEHDRQYTTGRDHHGRPITRAQADASFLRCCRAVTKDKPLPARVLPYLYWLAVRLFGAGHWTDAKDEREKA